MPNRTKEERELIDSLPVKAPTKYCNARHGRGYCENPAGFGTNHPGIGRCKHHGGNAGRTAKDYYGDKMITKLRADYDKMVKDPDLINLNSEFAVVKTLLLDVVHRINEKIENQEDWIVQDSKKGRSVSAELEAFIKVIEQMRKIFKDIVDAETKSKNIMTPKSVTLIIQNITNIMGDTCGSCPIRQTVADKFEGVEEAKIIKH